MIIFHPPRVPEEPFRFFRKFAKMAPRGTTCVVHTGGKLSTGIVDTGGKFFPAIYTYRGDTGGKFATGVNIAGGQQ